MRRSKNIQFNKWCKTFTCEFQWKNVLKLLLKDISATVGCFIQLNPSRPIFKMGNSFCLFKQHLQHLQFLERVYISSIKYPAAAFVSFSAELRCFTKCVKFNLELKPSEPLLSSRYVNTEGSADRLGQWT